MDIQNISGNDCLKTRHSSLKEWIKVSSGIIRILIVVPNRGTFICRRKVLQGWGAGQGWNGMCAGLICFLIERCN
eukprot:4989730-Ditylum_brightwellii.AAC.1